MKRKLLLSILAVIPALFLPLAAVSQLNPDADMDTTPAAQAAPSYKYEVFAGWGYTSLNQVNQSRYGLQGVNLSVTRDWGRFFGVTADGAFYSTPLVSNSSNPNPGNPSVDSVLMGPVFHGHLFGRTSAFFRVLLGGEHTGGENAVPSVSFAGGVGVGMDYRLSDRFALRISGDDIASSFSANASSTVCSTTAAGCTAHMRRNSRAAIGLVYKF